MDWTLHRLWLRENAITATALDTMECQPTIMSLMQNQQQKTWQQENSNGSNGIPLYLVKKNKSSLLLPLRQCWKERSVQQDIRGAKTIIYRTRRRDVSIYFMFTDNKCVRRSGNYFWLFLSIAEEIRVSDRLRRTVWTFVFSANASVCRIYFHLVILCDFMIIFI